MKGYLGLILTGHVPYLRTAGRDPDGEDALHETIGRLRKRHRAHRHEDRAAKNARPARHDECQVEIVEDHARGQQSVNREHAADRDEGERQEQETRFPQRPRRRHDQGASDGGRKRRANRDVGTNHT